MSNFAGKLYRCLLVLGVLLMSACSQSGNGSNQVEIEHLIGLWNSSENKSGKSDIIYTRISSDSTIVEYDFDGDAFDQGLECYQVNTGSLKAVGANRFLVKADMHNDKQFMVELELLDAGHALIINFLGEKKPRIILKSQIWTKMADDNFLENEPSCRNLDAE